MYYEIMNGDKRVGKVLPTKAVVKHVFTEAFNNEPDPLQQALMLSYRYRVAFADKSYPLRPLYVTDGASVVYYAKLLLSLDDHWGKYKEKDELVSSIDGLESSIRYRVSSKYKTVCAVVRPTQHRQWLSKGFRVYLKRSDRDNRLVYKELAFLFEEGIYS